MPKKETSPKVSPRTAALQLGDKELVEMLKNKLKEMRKGKTPAKKDAVESVIEDFLGEVEDKKSGLDMIQEIESSSKVEEPIEQVKMSLPGVKKPAQLTSPII